MRKICAVFCRIVPCKTQYDVLQYNKRTAEREEMMNSQLKRGTLELCVLSILSDRDCYGYELVNTISQSMAITEGTIYPLLKRLKDDGSISSYLAESNEGPPRKYYTLTDFGRKKLYQQREQWEAFVASVNRILSSGGNTYV